MSIVQEIRWDERCVEQLTAMSLTFRFSCAVILVLILSVVYCQNATSQPLIRGDHMTKAQLAQLIASIPSLTTIDAPTALQKDLLAQGFSLHPSQISQFRWGETFAPADHPAHDCLFLTVWYWEKRRKEMRSVHINPTGTIKRPDRLKVSYSVNITFVKEHDLPPRLQSNLVVMPNGLR
jgi:hypothetical protein